VGDVREVINAMRAAVPPGQGELDPASVQRLRDLTRTLAAARTGAEEEYARYLMIGRRSLCLPEERLSDWLHDATVVVTGGTGCIGSTLMARIAERCPARLVSLSRSVTTGWPAIDGAQYRQADIRDRPAVAAVMREIRPDVVFHVAAQRSPALAETEVHRTVTTNVLGTRNVVEAAAEAGVPRVVCASTGKALRPYSPDVYTAAKRAAEWVVSRAAAAGGTCYSAARFTHVVNNSIVYRRLQQWADGGVVRLHSPDIVFYAQSALESAQLMMVAGLDARPGEFQIHAITDLGWPVSLLDLALGLLAQTGSEAPVYFSGYERGYEEIPFPGLYDPATAGDVSPLLNAFEAARAIRSTCPMTDRFVLEMAPDTEPGKYLRTLEQVCEMTQDGEIVRSALDDLSWSLLDATLSVAQTSALARSVAMADPHRNGLGPAHQRILTAIRLYAGLRELAATRPGPPPVCRPANRSQARSDLGEVLEALVGGVGAVERRHLGPLHGQVGAAAQVAERFHQQVVGLQGVQRLGQ
jgi:nucleoside-diphosphate-sugar epimerase